MKSSKKTSRKKKPAQPAARKKSARPSSSSPKRIVNIRQLGDVVNLKERRLYMLRNEGMPQVSPGRYDLGACCRWYVRYLQRKIAERANPPETSAAAVAGVDRHRLLSAQAEMKQIELAEKREGLISRDRAEKDTAKIIAEIRRRILALSPKIAADVVGETDLAVSQVKIDRSLKGALEALSEFDPDEPVAASPARSSSRSRTQ